MSDNERAAQTPLRDLLQGVPEDSRMTWQYIGEAEGGNIPIGNLCHRAAKEIDDLKSSLAQAEQERDRFHFDYDAAVVEIADLRRQLVEAKELEAFHPRAVKLMRKRKPFIVIAHDEPYFLKAYGLIRAHEKKIGRWSGEDEKIYQSWVPKRKQSWFSMLD